MAIEGTYNCDDGLCSTDACGFARCRCGGVKRSRFRQHLGRWEPTSVSHGTGSRSGGLVNALIYTRPAPSFFIGDVLVMEPGGGLSDILRFTPNNNWIVFYSDIGDGTPADVGFPTDLYFNQVTIQEV